MKKILLLLATTLLPLIAMGQKMSLNVTMNDLDKNTRIVVNELKENKMVPVDTVALDEKGSIKIKREGSEPVFLMLIPEGIRGLALHCLILPSEKINLTTDYLQDYRTFKVTKVSGSANMELYQKYNNCYIEGIANESERPNQPQKIENIIKTQPDLLMSAFLVTYFESAFEQYYHLYKQVFDALKGRYSDHEFVRHLNEKLKNAVVVGMEAPDIVLPDTSGIHQMKLSDLRGKVVLVDFWASWCRPCRMENPNVVKLYQKYHDKGFEIFSVSLDNDRDKWLKAIADDNLSWPSHVSELMGWRTFVCTQYGINSIPATVLVDRDGKVLARNLRGSQLDNKLKEIFGE